MVGQRLGSKILEPASAGAFPASDVIFADTVVNAASCSSLDNIVTALYREIQRRLKHPELSENRSSLLRIYEMQPQLFQQLMTTILRIAMFEEGRNHWSLSRPLLGLVLLCDQVQELSSATLYSAQFDLQICFCSIFKNYSLASYSHSLKTNVFRWRAASPH